MPMDQLAANYDRETLRQKLRSKIQGKRQSGGGTQSEQIARRMKEDPTTALLSLGIEDAFMLDHAKKIVQNPQAVLRDMSLELSRSKEGTKASPVVLEETSDDEEEGPPPHI